MNPKILFITFLSMLIFQSSSQISGQNSERSAAVLSDQNSEIGSAAVREKQQVSTQEQASTQEIDQTGWNDLHKAAFDNKFEIVEALINSGADCNATIHNPKSIWDGFSALHLACSLGHRQAVGALLRGGANCNATIVSKEDDQFFTKAGVAVEVYGSENPQHGLSPLHLASLNGHVQVVKVLLKYNADNNATIDNPRTKFGGFAPIHLAAINGHVQVVKALLKLSRNANSIPTNSISTINNIGSTWDGFSPLHLACARGHLQVVQAFLNPKFNPHINDTVSSVYCCYRSYCDGFSPLHLASLGGHTQVVEALIKGGADVNAPVSKSGYFPGNGMKDTDGYNAYRGCSPLHIALNEGHTQVAKILLNNGAKVMPQQNSSFVTKILKSIVRLPFKIGGFQDDCEDTALPLAILNKNLDVIEALQNPKNIDSTAAVDIPAQTSQNVAKQTHITPTKDVLSKCDWSFLRLSRSGYVCNVNDCKSLGVNFNVRVPANIRDIYENETYEWRYQHLQLTNLATCTPLMIAAYTGNFPLVSQLITETNADINAIDQKGRTALMHVARFGQQTSARVFTERKYEPCKAIAKLLIKSGADTKIRDNNGDTALTLAILNKNDGVIEALQNPEN